MRLLELRDQPRDRHKKKLLECHPFPVGGGLDRPCKLQVNVFQTDGTFPPLLVTGSSLTVIGSTGQPLKRSRSQPAFLNLDQPYPAAHARDIWSLPVGLPESRAAELSGL